MTGNRKQVLPRRLVLRRVGQQLAHLLIGDHRGGGSARVHSVDANVLLREQVCIATHKTHYAVLGGEVAQRPRTLHVELGAHTGQPGNRAGDHDGAAIPVLEQNGQGALNGVRKTSRYNGFELLEITDVGLLGQDTTSGLFHEVDGFLEINRL